MPAIPAPRNQRVIINRSKCINRSKANQPTQSGACLGKIEGSGWNMKEQVPPQGRWLSPPSRRCPRGREIAARHSWRQVLRTPAGFETFLSTFWRSRACLGKTCLFSSITEKTARKTALARTTRATALRRRPPRRPGCSRITSAW